MQRDLVAHKKLRKNGTFFVLVGERGEGKKKEKIRKEREKRRKKRRERGGRGRGRERRKRKEKKSGKDLKSTQLMFKSSVAQSKILCFR